MKQLRCALYARVSTTNHHQDPEMQLGDMRPFAQSREWEIMDTYVDRCTGKKDKRPALSRLMADAKQRKFDVVVVWKLDRFARSLTHLVNALAEFESLGIQFVSLRDNIDLTTASGRLMFQIIGAMAEFEHSLIVERVNAGLRNAIAKGKTLGRPKLRIDPAAMSRTTRWRRARALAATPTEGMTA
jgi:DNA invertase Pin-like site-specific DNA recombinase